jgi:hypothetical protein
MNKKKQVILASSKSRLKTQLYVRFSAYLANQTVFLCGWAKNKRYYNTKRSQIWNFLIL